jgi:hypothetical protein
MGFARGRVEGGGEGGGARMTEYITVDSQSSLLIARGARPREGICLLIFQNFREMDFIVMFPPSFHLTDELVS